jgi:transposase
LWHTRDKSDDKDAVLIARLVAQLRCYVPERADETWARLRHLGVRRERLVARHHHPTRQLGCRLAGGGELPAAA